ncbi:MAG: class I SAM-dependent methyltransferase [Bacteroidetes bacterium]|nr:class I SAM-dependent methyltransferase [Bacteroidota bacterium]
MDDRHQKMFNEQEWYSEGVINSLFIFPEYKEKRVLEIGCAEGGGLHYFARNGATCYGIEYSKSRYENAAQQGKSLGIIIIHGDILNPDTYYNEISEPFDFIIMRDVIEHVFDQELAMKNIKELLNQEGKLFISFPPKYSPFAGHQQNSSRILGKLPFLHLLPTLLYRLFLMFVLEKKEKIDSLLEIKKTRISINKFEGILSRTKLKITLRNLYFIRPCFKYRWGLNRRINIFGFLPIIREIFTLGALYVIEKND